MAAPFGSPYTAMARVRIVNATVGGEMVFAAPAHRPDVQSILIPVSDVVETSLERVRMADEMYQALCRIAEMTDSLRAGGPAPQDLQKIYKALENATDIAAAVIAMCDALQDREIDAAIAEARPAAEATQAALRGARIAECLR